MGRKHKKHHRSEKTDRPLPEEVEKPLKLVLKVGAGDRESTPSPAPTPLDVSDASMQPQSPETHKHKHKKKKKKHKREKHEKDRSERKDRKREASEFQYVEEASMDLPPEPPTAKRVLYAPEVEMTPISPMTPEPPSSRARGEISDGLRQCLMYLQRQLQRKDLNGFFAFPVTDSIAPGYSSIISNPMDFSTLKSNIDSHEYNSVAAYKKDFVLMCENCMTYNRPETIYYKEAKRILQAGLKAMSKENLTAMRKNLRFMGTITDAELGLDAEGEEITVEALEAAAVVSEPIPLVPVVATAPKPKPPKVKLGQFEAIPDDMEPEMILAQASAAAQDAATELSLRRPNAKIGFMRRKNNGTTTLNIINPDNTGIVSENERVVNLGALVGRLTSGSGNMAGFREDKRNKATPVTYMNYGPFSSHAPSYDSAFSTLSKEESDLLLATYGDETGAAYAKSLKSFVEDAGDFTVKMADNILDILTGGHHSRTMALLKQKEDTEKAAQKAQGSQEVKEEKMDVDGAANPQTPSGGQGEAGQGDVAEPDMNSLRSLSDIGINMSFLDAFEDKTPREDTELNRQLQATSKLINDLQDKQYERLSKRPPPHLAHVAKPSPAEMELGDGGTSFSSASVTPSTASASASTATCNPHPLPPTAPGAAFAQVPPSQMTSDQRPLSYPARPQPTLPGNLPSVQLSGPATVLPPVKDAMAPSLPAKQPPMQNPSQPPVLESAQFQTPNMSQSLPQVQLHNPVQNPMQTPRSSMGHSLQNPVQPIVSNPMQPAIQHTIQLPGQNPVQATVNNPMQVPIQNAVLHSGQNLGQVTIHNPVQSSEQNFSYHSVQNQVQNPVPMQVQNTIQNQIRQPTQNPLQLPVQNSVPPPVQLPMQSPVQNQAPTSIQSSSQQPPQNPGPTAVQNPSQVPALNLTQSQVQTSGQHPLSHSVYLSLQNRMQTTPLNPQQFLMPNLAGLPMQNPTPPPVQSQTPPPQQNPTPPPIQNPTQLPTPNSQTFVQNTQPPMQWTEPLVQNPQPAMQQTQSAGQYPVSRAAHPPPQTPLPSPNNSFLQHQAASIAQSTLQNGLELSMQLSSQIPVQNIQHTKDGIVLFQDRNVTGPSQQSTVHDPSAQTIQPDGLSGISSIGLLPRGQYSGMMMQQNASESSFRNSAQAALHSAWFNPPRSAISPLLQTTTPPPYRTPTPPPLLHSNPHSLPVPRLSPAQTVTPSPSPNSHPPRVPCPSSYQTSIPSPSPVPSQHSFHNPAITASHRPSPTPTPPQNPTPPLLHSSPVENPVQIPVQNFNQTSFQTSAQYLAHKLMLQQAEQNRSQSPSSLNQIQSPLMSPAGTSDISVTVVSQMPTHSSLQSQNTVPLAAQSPTPSLQLSAQQSALLQNTYQSPMQNAQLFSQNAQLSVQPSQFQILSQNQNFAQLLNQQQQLQAGPVSRASVVDQSPAITVQQTFPPASQIKLEPPSYASSQYSTQQLIAHTQQAQSGSQSHQAPDNTLTHSQEAFLLAQIPASSSASETMPFQSQQVTSTTPSPQHSPAFPQHISPLPSALDQQPTQSPLKSSNISTAGVFAETQSILYGQDLPSDAAVNGMGMVYIGGNLPKDTSHLMGGGQSEHGMPPPYSHPSLDSSMMQIPTPGLNFVTQNDLDLPPPPEYPNSSLPHLNVNSGQYLNPTSLDNSMSPYGESDMSQLHSPNYTSNEGLSSLPPQVHGGLSTISPFKKKKSPKKGTPSRKRKFDEFNEDNNNNKGEGTPGRKVFHCAQCSYGSTRHYNLKRHLRTHGITDATGPLDDDVAVNEVTT